MKAYPVKVKESLQYLQEDSTFPLLEYIVLSLDVCQEQRNGDFPYMMGKEPCIGTCYGSNGIGLCNPIADQPLVRNLCGIQTTLSMRSMTRGRDISIALTDFPHTYTITNVCGLSVGFGLISDSQMSDISQCLVQLLSPSSALVQCGSSWIHSAQLFGLQKYWAICFRSFPPV